MGYIYCIRNKLTGKRYIGQTGEEDPETRWKAHVNCIRRGAGCPALRDAFQKHGEEMFEFQVLIICFDEDRFEYEKQYIKQYNTIAPNGYNIAEGGVGGGGFRGKTHSDEAKEKIGKRSQEMWKNKDYKKKCSERSKEQMKNMKLTGVDWAKITINSEKWQKAYKEGRVGGTNRIISENTKKKISESLKNYYDSTPDHTHAINKENHRKAMAEAVGIRVSKIADD